MLIDSIRYFVTGDALTVGDDVSYVIELFKRDVSVWATSFDGMSNVLTGSIWEATILASGEVLTLDADELVITATDVERDRQEFRINGSEFYIPLTGAGVTEEYRFDLPPTCALTISTVGPGSTHPSPGQYTYNEGDLVTVTAIPDAGVDFLRWQYDSIIYTNNPLTFTIWDDLSLQGIFETPAEVSVAEAGIPWELPAVAAGLVVLGLFLKSRK